MPQFFVQLRVHVTEGQKGTLAFEGELDIARSSSNCRRPNSTPIHRAQSSGREGDQRRPLRFRRIPSSICAIEGTGSLAVDQRMRDS